MIRQKLVFVSLGDSSDPPLFLGHDGFEAHPFKARQAQLVQDQDHQFVGNGFIPPEQDRVNPRFFLFRDAAQHGEVRPEESVSSPLKKIRSTSLQGDLHLRNHHCLRTCALGVVDR
jgi:hypothetical protein